MVNKEITTGEVCSNKFEGPQASARKYADSEFKFAGQGYSRGLNNNFVLIKHSGTYSPDKLVLRVPKSDKERSKTIVAIEEEFNGMHLARLGVSYRLRSIPEQAQCIQNLYLQGFKVLSYLDTDRETILFPFVEGISLDKYVQNDQFDFEVVRNVLNHLTEAHKYGVVFGDRWVTNTLVLANNDFVEIDFDMELMGEHKTVSSFELAQTLYHLIHFASKNRTLMKDSLTYFYKVNPTLLNHYDLQKISSFLSRQAEFFHGKFETNGELYEGLVPTHQEIYGLIASLQTSLHKKRKY